MHMRSHEPQLHPSGGSLLETIEDSGTEHPCWAIVWGFTWWTRRGGGLDFPCTGSQKDYKIPNYLGQVVQSSLVPSHLLTHLSVLFGLLFLRIVDISLSCGPSGWAILDFIWFFKSICKIFLFYSLASCYSSGEESTVAQRSNGTPLETRTDPSDEDAGDKLPKRTQSLKTPKKMTKAEVRWCVYYFQHRHWSVSFVGRLRHHSLSAFDSCLYKLCWTKSLLVESYIRVLAVYLLYYSLVFVFLSCLWAFLVSEDPALPSFSFFVEGRGVRYF